jgi:FAD/FMN-containing dehydrogenase
MNRLGVDLVVKNVANMRDPIPGAPLLVLVEFEAMNPEGLRSEIERSLAAALHAGDAEAVLIAENANQSRDFWALRERMSAGHRPEGPQVSHDVSVPVSKIPDFLARADAAVEAILGGARIVAFGHMGDGNIHHTVMAPAGADAAGFPAAALTQAVYEAVSAFDGSISAEHGIGVTRKDDLARFKDAESLALMHALKRALDPNNIMNPRVLFA